MALNENIVIRLMADTSNYTTRMQAASTQAETMAKAMEKPMTTGQRMEAGFTKAGLAVGALSAAIGVAAVKSFIDFDAKMSEVATNSGATGSSLNALREAALNASRTTIYSAEDAADAINELAKAGVSVTDILGGGLHAALSLAATDNMSVGDATKYMASAMTQFGLTGKQAGQVADALAAGANKALGSVSSMGEALSMVGSTSHMLGANMQETVGTLSAMANAGNIGSEAGTELRSALIGLMSPSKQVKSEMDNLGLSLYDGQGKFVGIANFAGQLKDKLSKLTPEQRNQAMGVLFSNAAMSAANTLYKEGKDGIDKWTKSVSQSGYAADIAAKKTDNFKGDMTKFVHTAQDVLIGLGSAANGPLRSVTQNATDLLNLFRSMPASSQQWVLGAGLIIGATAGLHKMFGGLAESTSGFQRGLGQVVDPMTRLKTAAPQLSAGLSMLTSALHGPEQGVGLMANGLTRGKTAMSGLKSVGGGLMSMLGGPWGIALTGASIAVGILAQRQHDAQQRANAYADALDKGTDAAMQLQKNIATGNNISWSWWNKQQTGADGFAKALDKAGISAKIFAQAAAGNKIALAQYNDQMDKLKLGTSDQVTLGQHVNGVFSEQKKAIDDSRVAAKAQAEAEKEETKQKVANTVAQANGTKAVQEGAAADEKAADSKDILAEAFGATTKGVKEQAGALGEVVDALKTFYGFTISASDADIQLHDSFDKATKAVDQNGQTLDINSEKGRANQSALNDIAKAAMSSAEAHARAGDAVDKINPIMEDARNHYIETAKAMGKTPEEAAAMADSVGLSAKAVQDLTDRIAAANAKPLKISDQASKTLDDVGIKAKSLPDGKTIKLSGDNKEALEAFATVNGLKIDPKTGTLDLNKQQFEVALAIANGAKINPKTGELLGDNSDHFRKIAQSNGWKIDKKTGVISGDDGPFRAVKGNVDKATIGKKTVQVGADASGFWSTVNGILGQVFHVNVSSGGKHASGGLINGPGTGTSDDIPAKLSNGEYVVRAAAVKQYGVGMLNAINWQRYAAGGPVRKYEATPLPSARHMAPEGKRIVYNQYITNEIHSTGSSRVDEALLSARVRAGTGAMLQGRTL